MPRTPAYTGHLLLSRAFERFAESLVAFERKVSDPRIYGPMLDVPGALEEIKRNTICFIKMGDIVVGTAAYRLRADKSVYISNLAVDPAYRGQGVARATMLLILGKCNQAPRVDLVTHPENNNAFQLYTSLGSKVESRKENYFGDGEPRLVLVLTPPHIQCGVCHDIV
jgi:ribosomal protein S18 acetylase RimI-like enzyme